MKHKNITFSKEPGQKGPHIVSLNLYEIFRKGKSMGTENRLVAVWGSGQRRTRKDYKPTRERFCGDGRVLKLDCGDACTTL